MSEEEKVAAFLVVLAMLAAMVAVAAVLVNEEWTAACLWVAVAVLAMLAAVAKEEMKRKETTMMVENNELSAKVKTLEGKLAVAVRTLPFSSRLLNMAVVAAVEKEWSVVLVAAMVVANKKLEERVKVLEGKECLFF